MINDPDSEFRVATVDPVGFCEPLPAPMRIDGMRQPSTDSLAVKEMREEMLRTYDALKAEEPSLGYRKAARILGTNITALCRLLAKREKKQDLTPLHHLCGQKPKHGSVKALLEAEAVKAKLTSLYVSTIGSGSEEAGNGRRTGVVSLTLQRFAEEPECPPMLVQRLQSGQQPKELVSFLRKITPEIEARIRGVKHFNLNGIESRRDQTIRLPDGSRALNMAGYLIEFDDMSVNQPFFVNLPDGKWLLSRQGLYARDVKSGRWLGVELVGRPREAYRAEDILRFLRKLMLIYGRFTVIRLEKGIWGARSLKGYKITENGALEEEEFTRDAMDEGEKAKLQDGLAAIGVRIHYVSSPHHKGSLESSFRWLQTIIATYTTDFNNMGRYAGEFELVAKRIRQVRAESHHPAALRFAPIDVLADRIEKAMDFSNKRVRRGLNAYAEWERDIAQRELPPINERDLAAFLPEKRDRTIDHGRVSVTVDGITHDFRADIFIELGTGYRVFIKFDSSEPPLGAAIYNRETSSSNHMGFKVGEFICLARWEMPGPQLDAPKADGLQVVSTQHLYGVGPEHDNGYAARKSQDKRVRTEFRGLVKAGQPSVRIAEVRDGRGNFARVTQGDGSAAAAPQPEQPQLPAPKKRKALALTATQDEFEQQSAFLARLAASAEPEE